jgi:CPA2 family monovalent cation:H+ antiporter-2
VVGEFSFILATLGLSLRLIPDDAFQLVVAAALVSITLNPFVFRLVEPMERRIAERPGLARLLEGAPRPTSCQAGVAETARPVRVP